MRACADGWESRGRWIADARVYAVGALQRRRGKAEFACSTSSLLPTVPLPSGAWRARCRGVSWTWSATADASPPRHFRCFDVKPLW